MTRLNPTKPPGREAIRGQTTGHSKLWRKAILEIILINEVYTYQAA